MENSSVIETSLFYELNIAGMCALVNEEKKVVYFFYSANIQNYLSRLFKDSNDYRNFSLVILETWYHPCDSQVALPYYYNQYRNAGYLLLNENRNLLKYKVEYVVEGDSVGVYLRNRRHKPRLVGRFNSMILAKEFVDKYYFVGYHKIVTCLN